MKKRGVFFTLCGIAFLCMIYAGYQYFYNTPNNTITYTSSGFRPTITQVEVGATVTFVNKNIRPMWPASDIHPSHELYPEFDARGGIMPGESWSFVASEEGLWKYHDHLSSQFVGTLIVGDDSISPCDNSDSQECWMNRIETMIEEEGVAAAFDEMVHIHREYPDFASSCHNFAHDIGLKAYIYHGFDIELTPKTSYCNAGFWHGYLEGVISEADDKIVAQAFCEEVDEALRDGFPLAGPQCVHGIGHGLLENYITTRLDLWAQPNELINLSVADCEAMMDGYDETMRCVSGIFNVFRDFIVLNDDYRDYINADNLFEICGTFSERYSKESCYWELAKVVGGSEFIEPLLETGEGTFPVTNIVAEDIETYLPFTTRSWSITMGRRMVKTNTPEEVVRACRVAPPDVQIDCIQGLAEGAFFSAEPTKEVATILPLCTYDGLTLAETERCYWQLQQDIFYTYDKETIANMCSEIPTEVHTEQGCGTIVRDA